MCILSLAGAGIIRWPDGVPDMNCHEMKVEVGFRHCDPAGIVFYPRYAEMVNDTVEHWFGHGLGVGFDGLHRVRGIAIPMVRLDFHFMAPSRLGETLRCVLRVKETGRSSVALVVDLVGQEGSARVRAAGTFVFVDMQSMKPSEMPSDLRRSIEAYR